jgi:hypothetical protein
MLFPMLDDRTGHAHEISIPAILIEADDGDRIKTSLHNNQTLIALLESEPGTILQNTTTALQL